MVGVPTSSPIPLYHQVFGVLRQRVLDETYAPGARLAPEDELAYEFQVSRATIRQAVGELVKSGMVARKQGRGTFVLPTARDSLGQVFRGSLADLFRETSRANIRSVEVCHASPVPERIARELGLHAPTGTIVRRTRTMDGEAFAYTINYLDDEHGGLLSERELTAGSLMQLLERKGVAFASARQTIRAQMGDPVVCTALDVALGTPVLFVERLLFDGRDEPVEFVQSWYRGDLYEYTVTFEPGDGDFASQFA